MLGHGLRPPTKAGRVNRKGVTGVKVMTDEPDKGSSDYAELVLATDTPATSRQTHLYRGHWFDALEVYWKDLHRPGPFADRDYGTSDTAGGMGRNRDSSLVAAHVTVAPGETRTVRFALSWYAPNFRKYWVTPVWHFRQASGAIGQWKNWYATEWTGAEQIAAEVLLRWAELRDETLQFRDALYGSTLPLPVLDAAAANLSILKSPTTLRLEDGTFYGWEGCHPAAGSCEGSCTHVWNYQQALPFLYPALERSMREADYKYNMNAAGGLSFRLSLPLGTSNDDRATLRRRPVRQHPQALPGLETVRRQRLAAQAVARCQAEPGIRLESGQPRSLGSRTERRALGPPAPYARHGAVRTEFLADRLLSRGSEGRGGDGGRARRAGHRDRLSRHLRAGTRLGRQEPLQWRVLRSGGRPWRPVDPCTVRQGGARGGVLGDTVEQLYWSAEHKELKYQMGGGCLIDQTLGQWHARLYGLGDIFDPAKTATSLASIYRYNFKRRLGDIYNPCRVFGLYDEAGTVIATWPDASSKPAVPVPYAQETMHGMEYAFGQMLMAYGMIDEGVRRHGRRSRPLRRGQAKSVERDRMRFNYARSMASWGAIVILSGFSFDASAGHIGFAPEAAVGWASSAASGREANAHGTVMIGDGGVTLSVAGGELCLASLGLPAGGGGPAAALVTGLPVAFDQRRRRGSRWVGPAARRRRDAHRDAWPEFDGTAGCC